MSEQAGSIKSKDAMMRSIDEEKTMRASTTLTYWKTYNKYLYRHQLEREHSDRSIESEDIAADVQREIEEMMERESLKGKITITISIGDE